MQSIKTLYIKDLYCVQKHKLIDKQVVLHLRKLGVIEGKMPNVYVSAKIAEFSDEKAQYVKNKGFDEDAYHKWVISYLEAYQLGKKQDFIELLNDKLPDSLDKK